MPSPFPGMDPYLERHWRDVHHSLCTYARDALQPQIRPKLVARLEESLVVESDDGDDSRAIVPDVRVEEFRGGDLIPAGGTAVAENEPLVLRVVRSEPAYQGFIQITDPTNGNRLVTVIEFLSPTNKRRGGGQRQYRQKQQELSDARVTLVEVDLIRAGTWTVQIPLGSIPRNRRAPFNTCVHRGGQADTYEVYAVPITRPLPKIRVPLRRGDADAVLELQALLTQAYDNGIYGETIDYTADADPPLTGDAAAWAHGLLRASGHRAPPPA